MQDRRHRPRRGIRFGFENSTLKERVEHREATVDEILESLGRHARLANQLGPYDGSEAEEVTEGFFDAKRPPRLNSSRYRLHGPIGTYGFALILLGGLVILMVYGVLRMVMSASSASSVGMGSLLLSILNDPLRLGFLGLLCLVGALVARRRGRNTVFPLR
jgi:hypothetical protein